MLKLIIQLICILLLGVTQSYCTHISAKSMDNDQPDSLDIMEETSWKTDDVAVVHQHNTVQWNETTMNPEWTVSVDENSTNSVNETENHILTETVSEVTANAGTNKENQTKGVSPVSMAKVEPALDTQEPHSDQHASYWDVFKNEDETGTIADLLDRMLNALNVSSNSWNKYLYITALESPDGSLYVPYNHRQGTRNHLATLLGFAKFVVTNKDVRQRMGANGDGNDQAFIDSSKLMTVPPTTEEHVTDKIRNGPKQICSEMLSTRDNVVSSTDVEKMTDDCEVDNGIINTTIESDEDSVVHNATTWFDLSVDRQLTDSIDLTNSASIDEREYLSTVKPENQLLSEMFPDTKNNSSKLNSAPEKTDSLMTKLVKLIESFLNVLSRVGKQGSHNYTMNSSLSDMSKGELKPVDEK
ncbi:hypothetical protein EG68_05923 [Paragonimus skrjabini miyazakii]|uniref:Uncharacterized protein n=1 Tax=Paragonimus skrjabini miyazakii TaxID=59628 RepID=A0A8S9YMJ7_9TREM|nr:hypothetical protein EG68_05923 [Paragonimus skrjabini miyazakii]